MAEELQIQVKQEQDDPNPLPKHNPSPGGLTPSTPIIDLSSSDSESDSSSDDEVHEKKKRKTSGEGSNSLLPVGFLDPLPRKLPPVSSSTSERSPLALPRVRVEASTPRVPAIVESSIKQFWKAGDYVGNPSGDWDSSNGGMDRVRVHPKFLHSNATSHKWVLGAFAELLDNALDEVHNGATYVNVDMVQSKKNGSKMLLIEDNGGGMDPDKMRHCMSLGYSAKSKIADTIGQYGNGFKTSTMRLGADVIVFSRCRGTGGKRPSQSIGLLSYTFLTTTGKEDIVVPMLDYERSGQDWNGMVRSSSHDWFRNVETVVQWSPFSSEDDLLQQFDQMQDQGTRIIIYNLWEDDQGLLELDFDTDPHDIQIRGANRDEKRIEMAELYPNSRHFLTYRHSLRSYAAILYLRVPPGFRIILRGEDVDHHNIVNDMMMSQEITYRPQPGVDGIPKESNLVAVVTVGFVKDAKSHIDVQGFNVYHKNRLIKPFWRVWHPPGSDGRGVIGLLEANFVEPAHDKQGFERTTVLSRLESRLIHMQKTYWSSNCHKIGYAPRRSKKANENEMSPDFFSPQVKKSTTPATASDKTRPVDKGNNSAHLNGKSDARTHNKRPIYNIDNSSSDDDDRQQRTSRKHANGSQKKASELRSHETSPYATRSLRTTVNPNTQERVLNRDESSVRSSDAHTVAQLREENQQLRERLKKREVEILGDLMHDLRNEKEKCKSLEAQLEEANRKYEELSKEQETLVDIFSDERERRDREEEELRKKMKEASNTIQELRAKVKSLESR